MTDYNDGVWHGWNGGECPVNDDSIVEGMYLRDGSPALESPVTDRAAHFDWRLENANTLIAFRVVKAYREPREWWVNEYQDRFMSVHNTLYEADRDAGLGRKSCIHVREVLE